MPRWETGGAFYALLDSRFVLVNGVRRPGNRLVRGPLDPKVEGGPVVL